MSRTASSAACRRRTSVSSSHGSNPPVNGKSSTWRAITRRTEAFPGHACADAGRPGHRHRPAQPGLHRNRQRPAPGSRATRGTASTSTRSRRACIGDRRHSVRREPGPPRRPRDPHLAEPLADQYPGQQRRLHVSHRRPAAWSQSPAARSSTTTPAMRATTTCRSTATRASTCSTARCATSRTRSTRSPATSIDLKVMIHKIHAGANLPSVQAGGFYGIFGFGNTFTDYSEIALHAGPAQLPDLPPGERQRHAAGVATGA